VSIILASAFCFSTLCGQTWLAALANTYLSLLRIIAGYTRQFEATSLILQGSNIHREYPRVLSLLEMIAGDIRQFKATSLILQGSSIHREYPSVLSLLEMIAGDTRQFKVTLLILQQHRSQPHPNCYSNGNAVEIPPLIHLTMSRLKVVEVDDEESKQTLQRLHDH
jgi:hypothetical protein